MQNIELIKDKKTGGYDWNFLFNDLNTVTGDNKIISDVIHTILLKPSELLPVFYEDKGDPAWEYIREKPTENNLYAISETVEYELEQLEEVNAAKVEIIENINNNIVLKVVIETNNGGEVVIDGI